ncbi:hypothetical protein ACLBPK_29235, partial [Klebsiella pneumoniae]
RPSVGKGLRPAGGQLHGPSAWDGYAASVAADACIKAQGTSEPVEVTLPECPAFYKR